MLPVINVSDKVRVYATVYIHGCSPCRPSRGTHVSINDAPGRMSARAARPLSDSECRAGGSARSQRFRTGRAAGPGREWHQARVLLHCIPGKFGALSASVTCAEPRVLAGMGRAMIARVSRTPRDLREEGCAERNHSRTRSRSRRARWSKQPEGAAGDQYRQVPNLRFSSRVLSAEN